MEKGDIPRHAGSRHANRSQAQHHESSAVTLAMGVGARECCHHLQRSTPDTSINACSSTHSRTPRTGAVTGGSLQAVCVSRSAARHFLSSTEHLRGRGTKAVLLVDMKVTSTGALVCLLP